MNLDNLFLVFGVNEDSDYFLLYFNCIEEGIVCNNDMDCYSLLVKFNMQLSDCFCIGVGIIYINIDIVMVMEGNGCQLYMWMVYGVLIIYNL